MVVSVVITARGLINFFLFDLNSVIHISKEKWVQKSLNSISMVRPFYIANITGSLLYH